MLSGWQRTRLRGMAHGLKPVVTVGQNGVSAGVTAETDRALLDHELIKVRFAAGKENKRRLAAELAAGTGAELLGIVGHLAILYRPHPDPERRTIVPPERPV